MALYLHPVHRLHARPCAFQPYAGLTGYPAVIEHRSASAETDGVVRLLARLSAWSPADPEHARTREYQRCLAGVPWTVRAETTLDLARSRAFLDAGHAGHAAVKERLPLPESGGRKRAHGSRPAARLRKHRISHRPPTGNAPPLEVATCTQPARFLRLPRGRHTAR